jgi:translation initiation factor 4G
VIKLIKGVLNKLTPEKFEKLVTQVLDVVTTANILKETIRLVFENAVVQVRP